MLQVDSNCTGVVRLSRAPERSEGARASRLVALAGSCISFRAKKYSGAESNGFSLKHDTLTVDTSLKNIDFKTMNSSAN